MEEAEQEKSMEALGQGKPGTALPNAIPWISN